MENFQLRLELYENTFLWMQGDFKWHFPVLNLPNKETPILIRNLRKREST